MPKAASKTKKRIEIKDLNDVSSGALNKARMKAVKGGDVDSCGFKFDECRALKSIYKPTAKAGEFPKEVQIVDHTTDSSVSSRLK